MFAAKTSPSAKPAIVPKTPIEAPVIRNTRMIAPRVAPMVRRIAMSFDLSFTSMIRPETMFRAATMTIRVRMMNMTLRSTSRAAKKVRLRWRQSESSTGRSAAISIAERASSTRSALSRKTSTTVTSPSRLKKACASASGMNTKVASNSDIPSSKMALTS